MITTTSNPILCATDFLKDTQGCKCSWEAVSKQFSNLTSRQTKTNNKQTTTFGLGLGQNHQIRTNAMFTMEARTSINDMTLYDGSFETYRESHFMIKL